MDVKKIPIDKLLCDPANVRRHGPRNIEAIKASLLRFGQQRPIVVDASNVVIAGNGTLEAARSLGWSTLDVVSSELVGPDRAAYAIVDNRSAELAQWDDEALALMIGDFDADLQSILGWSKEQLDRMLDSLETPDTSEKLDGLQFAVVIDCDGEHHQAQLLERFTNEGLKCRALML